MENILKCWFSSLLFTRPSFCEAFSSVIFSLTSRTFSSLSAVQVFSSSSRARRSSEFWRTRKPSSVPIWGATKRNYVIRVCLFPLQKKRLHKKERKSLYNQFSCRETFQWGLLLFTKGYITHEMDDSCTEKAFHSAVSITLLLPVKSCYNTLCQHERE